MASTMNDLLNLAVKADGAIKAMEPSQNDESKYFN